MMRIRFSDDRKVFNMHKDGIPYLSFDMLDRLGVPNLFTTRFTDFDPDAGKGTEGLRVAVMNDEDEEEASKVVRGYRDILARQLGSSLERECITDQKHTNYVHVASSEDLGLSRKPLHMQSVDGVVTDIPDVLMTVFGADCPSIYIVDPVRKASGLVHAG